MAVENGHSVWIKRTWKIDQWVLRDFIFFLPVKKLNVGENKLFPLFEGVHSLRKSWYECLSFHLILLAFYFYLIFRIIWFVLTQLWSSRVYLLHRFSEQIRRQNNLKNFASRIYSFPFQFTRGKKY